MRQSATCLFFSLWSLKLHWSQQTLHWPHLVSGFNIPGFPWDAPDMSLIPRPAAVQCPGMWHALIPLTPCDHWPGLMSHQSDLNHQSPTVDLNIYADSTSRVCFHLSTKMFSVHHLIRCRFSLQHVKILQFCKSTWPSVAAALSCCHLVDKLKPDSLHLISFSVD